MAKTLILLFCLFSQFAIADGETSYTAFNQGTGIGSYYRIRDEDIPRLQYSIAKKREISNDINTGWNRFWSPNDTKKIVDRLDKEIAEETARISQLQKELSTMEKELTVKMWQSRFGLLQQVETKLGTSGSLKTCPVVKDGEFQFFENSAAFEGWNKGDKIPFYSHDNPYIHQCLKNKKEGASAKVDGTWQSLCKKPDLYVGTNKKYDLKKENGQIVISTSIAFNYKGKAENKVEAFKRIQDAIPCMKEFYARQGIRLELTIKEENGKETLACKHHLDLHDEFDRNNAVHWSSHKDQGRTLTPELRCSMYIHELTHNMGIADAYPDADCPDRSPVGATDDIMRTGGILAQTELKLYPLAIKTILGPLCGE